ncbi:MAG: hypothetical protein HUK06_08715, partial [Bacteroidaceae bacterium]|nr:hypothetical protein [Bacteroidaceae bacterium]
MKNRFLTIAIAVLTLTGGGGMAAPKKSVYIPMDYSTCGYHASEQAIPDIAPVYIIEDAREGVDYQPTIQAAIDKLAKQKANKQGMRGAIVLGKGEYAIHSALRISASGIVLRGAGKKLTTIKRYGVDRGAAIYIEGGKTTLATDTIYLADQKISAGATTMTLATTA